LNILGRDGGEGLDLDPLGRVVDPDQDKFCLPFAWAEGVDNVIPQVANSHGDTMLWSALGSRWDRDRILGT